MILFRLFLILLFLINVVQAQSVSVDSTLQDLLQDEDTDQDKKITVDDPHVTGTQKGDRRFLILIEGGRRMEVAGTYYLSNLLQELSLAKEAGLNELKVDPDRIFEPPVDRISRSIRELYWDGLTRKIDETGLNKTLSDEKTKPVDGIPRLYISQSDETGQKYYEAIAKDSNKKMELEILPEKITAEYVRGLDGYHGLLSLAVDAQAGALPFVVPGGRFNEMYGWDSYFIVLGLLQDDKVDLAKAMVDQFVYEIQHYGKILNANRTYYLTRSQPPFFTSMIRAVYEKIPPQKEWLRTTLNAAIQEYYTVWMNKDRLTPTGLSRYMDSGYGQPPEVEPGHFDVIYAEFAKQSGADPKQFESAYTSKKVKSPELDEYFVHDRCMRESGHDTSYRLERRCADLVTVDLNSLLYKIETDIAELIEKHFAGKFTTAGGHAETSQAWKERAQKRKALIDQYLWNESKGMYFDYDVVQRKQTGYASATTLYPLWARVANREQAELLVKKALPLLEMPGGIVSTTEESRGKVTPDHPQRQWDFPNGWSPHQILAWTGLSNYGYDTIAQRLAYRWLYTITINAAHYNGTVPEKFDVVTRSHQVFAEYGNVGTKFAYITREGFGWTNSSFQLGLKLLPAGLRSKLNQLIAPEWIFKD